MSRPQAWLLVLTLFCATIACTGNANINGSLRPRWVRVRPRKHASTLRPLDPLCLHHRTCSPILCHNDCVFMSATTAPSRSMSSLAWSARDSLRILRLPVGGAVWWVRQPVPSRRHCLRASVVDEKAQRSPGHAVGVEPHWKAPRSDQRLIAPPPPSSFVPCGCSRR